MRAPCGDLRAQIVWVLTDDQDIELGGLTPMTFSREHLGEQGAIGEAFYVNTPVRVVRPTVWRAIRFACNSAARLTAAPPGQICCPSRTEYLSGRMYHNVLSSNLAGCMHVNQTLHIFVRSPAAMLLSYCCHAAAMLLLLNSPAPPALLNTASGLCRTQTTASSR